MDQTNFQEQPQAVKKPEIAEANRLRGVLPDRLTQALRQSGLSRRSLAAIIGVHLNTVHAYASGQRFPRLSQLTLLAKALGVGLDWLLDLAGTADMSRDLRALEIEILEYVLVENRRGHFPSFVEISHAFDADPYWSSPYVRKLMRFGLLAQSGGFRLTRSAMGRLPDDGWKPRRKILRRTPLLLRRTPLIAR